MTDQDGSNETALITGASQGLGPHVAGAFARRGLDLVLTARREQPLADLSSQLQDQHDVEAEPLPADLRDPGAVTDALETIPVTLEPVTALMNNAGVYHREPLESTDLETFDEQFQVNCRGSFLLMKELLPAMADRGRGFVCNVLATGALRGSANHAAFNASKFGLRALTQSAAKEYQHRGVHVTGLIVDGQIDSERIRENQPDRAPETLLQPDSIAEEILHLHDQPRNAWTLETDLRPHTEYER